MLLPKAEKIVERTEVPETLFSCHAVLGYDLTSSTSAENRVCKLRAAVITSRKMWRRREVREDNTFLTLCKILGEKKARAVRYARPKCAHVRK